MFKEHYFFEQKCKYDRFVEMAFLQLLELVPDRIYKTIPKDDVFGTLKYDNNFYIIFII